VARGTIFQRGPDPWYFTREHGHGAHCIMRTRLVLAPAPSSETGYLQLGLPGLVLACSSTQNVQL